MKIYRSILLNDNEPIRLDNIGNSWSTCEIFAENHAKDINRFLGKDGYVVLCAYVGEKQIDTDNTALAADRRPNELEIVLLPGEIEATIYLSRVDGYEEGQLILGEVGNNVFEDYI